MLENNEKIMKKQKIFEEIEKFWKKLLRYKCFGYCDDVHYFFKCKN